MVNAIFSLALLKELFREYLGGNPSQMRCKGLLSVLICLLLFSCFNADAQETRSIQGVVSDQNGDGVPFANIQIKKGKRVIMGTASDFHGNYKLKLDNLPSGKYSLVATSIGFTTDDLRLKLEEEQTVTVDFQLYWSDNGFIDIGCCPSSPPMINRYSFPSTTVFSAQEIRRMPLR